MGQICRELVRIPEPSQTRSKEALERFLAAGEALLAENRFEEAGIADIARAAESSVGSFYRLLADKERLLLLLLQRFFEQIDELTEQTLDPDQWAGKTIADIADSYIKALVNSYRGHAGALRATILRSSKDREFRKFVHDFNSLVSSRLEKLLRERRDELNHPKPERAIKSVSHIILGILNQHTMTGSLDGLSEKALVEETKRIFITYLGVK
ncbi:MAG: TetR/AcrR family transcriptional regulator [Endozoicomonas sp.]